MDFLCKLELLRFLLWLRGIGFGGKGFCDCFVLELFSGKLFKLLWCCVGVVFGKIKINESLYESLFEIVLRDECI